MIKLRIEATPEEIDSFSQFLESLSRIEVLNASWNYANTRGKSKYSRRYLDIELKPLATVEEQDKQALIDAKLNELRQQHSYLIQKLDKAFLNVSDKLSEESEKGLKK